MRNVHPRAGGVSRKQVTGSERASSDRRCNFSLLRFTYVRRHANASTLKLIIISIIVIVIAVVVIVIVDDDTARRGAALKPLSKPRGDSVKKTALGVSLLIMEEI